MKIFLPFLLFVVGLVQSAFATNSEWKLLFSACDSSHDWSLIEGREFPGAVAWLGLDEVTGKLELSYNFSKGGQYVSMRKGRGMPSQASAFSLNVSSDQAVEVNYRLVDATGRTFQGKPVSLPSHGATDLIFPVEGPWEHAWGSGEHASPVQPLKSFELLVDNKGASKSGSILVSEMWVHTPEPPQTNVRGRNFNFSAGAWLLQGDWVDSADGMMLRLKAIANEPVDADLSLSFPVMGRNKVSRYPLSASQGEHSFYYRVPVEGGGNPFNAYQLKLRLSTVTGEAFEKLLSLKGTAADTVNFGSPMNSTQIPTSRFGVCVHFAFGTEPGWRSWKDYRSLIDAAADCGLKWIRDTVRVPMDEDGNYHVREHDLEWIRYAYEQGLNTIVLIGMDPDKSIDEYKKYAEEIVTRTKDYVKVYELGNEPNNFGWRQKYGGSWNGRAEDGSTEEWVLEHLKCTNALADHIKSVRPDAIVIGLGATAPTNFRALSEGVSRNLDGVVEHPYTYSMPPERVPFGWKHEKRDGVRVGDAEGTYVGLVESYHEHFGKTGQPRSLWMTETGYTSFFFNGKNEKGLYAGFTEEAQATYVVRRMIQSLTLPISVVCHYDLIDDYNSHPYESEANFGLLRTDRSPKPVYYAMQRLNSLFNGYVFDPDSVVTIEEQPLHRSAVRGELVHDWDGVGINASNEVLAYGFTNSGLPDERMLALWSAQPYSREFNNRTCTIRLKGWAGYGQVPVAVDLITGETFDVPVKADGDDLVLENFIIQWNPLVIKFFK